MQRKYLIWLRGILFVLYLLVIVDILVKRFYYHVPVKEETLRYIILGAVVSFFLYHVKEKKA